MRCREKRSQRRLFQGSLELSLMRPRSEWPDRLSSYSLRVRGGTQVQESREKFLFDAVLHRTALRRGRDGPLIVRLRSVHRSVGGPRCSFAWFLDVFTGGTKTRSPPTRSSGAFNVSSCSLIDFPGIALRLRRHRRQWRRWRRRQQDPQDITALLAEVLCGQPRSVAAQTARAMSLAVRFG